jgi:hypothetical protein
VSETNQPDHPAPTDMPAESNTAPLRSIKDYVPATEEPNGLFIRADDIESWKAAARHAQRDCYGD